MCLLSNLHPILYSYHFPPNMPSLRNTTHEDYFWYAIFPELVFCFILVCMFVVWKFYVSHDDASYIIIRTPRLQHIKPESVRVHIEYTPVVRKDATAERDASPIPALSLGSPALSQADATAEPDVVVSTEVKKNL